MLIKRSDGVDITKKIDPFQAVFPYIMKSRTASQVFIRRQLDIEPALAYLDQVNKGAKRKQLSLFSIVMAALVRVLAERPRLNRYVAGKKMYKRTEYSLSFIIKENIHNEDSQEATLKILFDPADTLLETHKKLYSAILKRRKHDDGQDKKIIKVLLRFPRFAINIFFALLRLLDYINIDIMNKYNIDPMFCSIFVANLGSIGLDAPYHHLYEYANCSIFFVMGKQKKVPVVADDGKSIIAKTVMDFSVTIDERISDGVYYAKSIELFEHYMMNPHKLEIPPEKITEDV